MLLLPGCDELLETEPTAAAAHGVPSVQSTAQGNPQQKEARKQMTEMPISEKWSHTS